MLCPYSCRGTAGLPSNTGSRNFPNHSPPQQRLRPADEATDDGENRQGDQRNQHGPRRFMNVVLNLVRNVRLSPKRHEDQAEHVERRQARGNPSDRPEQRVPVRSGKGLPQNFVLAEETCQAAEFRRSPAPQPPSSNRWSESCVLSAPILRMSCSPLMAWITLPEAKEQEGLEEGVRHQMKDARGECADAARQEHVTQLADGGIGDIFGYHTTRQQPWRG